MLEELSDRSLKFEVISGVRHSTVSLCCVKFLDFIFILVIIIYLNVYDTLTPRGWHHCLCRGYIFPPAGFLGVFVSGFGAISFNLMVIYFCKHIGV